MFPIPSFLSLFVLHRTPRRPAVLHRAGRLGAAAAAILFALSGPGAGWAADALSGFRIPLDGAAGGVVDFGRGRAPITETDAWVRSLGDGCYRVDGVPLRFWGVNVTAGMAFPTARQAEVHAARLARYGFNAVRFHHLEAPWEPDGVLVDYSGGTSRAISASRLDRLHYFQAQLAAQGIRSNVNLLVSRQFLPGDGLGEAVAQMTWKDQHVLGFFNEAALALQREYATALLTAPNPYRQGLPLARDPAVAIVEILNENGFLQRWYENVLDTMPAVYRAQLATVWNEWLGLRYASTAAMLAAWGATNEPLQASVLTNGDFQTGTTGWYSENHGTARSTTTVTSDYSGSPSARIAVTAAGSADWHVQFNQSGLVLEAGRLYTFSFWAKADRATPLYAVVQRAYGDYGTVGPGLTPQLDTEWRKFTGTIRPAAADNNVRINFGGFGNRIGTVWLADVRLQPGGSIGALPEGCSLEARNIPAVPHSTTTASPTAEQRKDWIRFIMEREERYWETMRRHIRETIGYPGIIVGTIAANSPLNTQAGLDASDSHAYWDHPTWPAGRDWDPVVWSIVNRSMVDDPNGGTIGSIARQRVRGRPHNVTEYQHASPNLFAAEGPLLVGAYGALQDWSGIWMFDYATRDTAHITGFFDHAGHPGRLANSILGAALFVRGDAARALGEHTMAFTPEKGLEIAASTGSAWRVGDGEHLGVPAAAALVGRLSLAIGPNAAGLTAPPVAPSVGAIRSDTGELCWDNTLANRGMVSIDTPRTKALVGHPAGRSWNLGGVEITPGTTRNDWCTVGITLLNGESFAAVEGGRALVVATGECANTGMTWTDATRTSLGNNWGLAPTVVEVVPATIVLPVAAARVSAWALDGGGQRAAAVAVTDRGGRAALALGGSGTTLWYEVEIRPAVAPASALTIGAVAGGTAQMSVDAAGATGYRWHRNGRPLDATSSVLSLAAVAPADAGLYDCVVTAASGDALSRPFVLGVQPTVGNRTAGAVATREEWRDIHHPNGAIYDQFLLTGTAGTFTADPNQIARMSFLDPRGSIVQVEMSGAGAITVVLDPATATGPKAPELYNQPGIEYMQGKATLILSGADQTTHFTVYSVGTATNPGVTRPDAPYFGWADVAAAGIVSSDGKLGGIHQGNARYNASLGHTGLYAPGVLAVGGLAVVHTVEASEAAQPYLFFGASGTVDLKIAGGSLGQANGDAVTVSGLRRLEMGAGRDSCGRDAPAQALGAALVNAFGSDVTATLVTGP